MTSRLIMYFINDAGLRGKRPTRNRTDRADTLLGWRLVSHAGVLQHVGPLSAGTSVTVLQVLSEMVCTEEFLCLVAFTKFVHMVQMLRSCVPICGIRKLFATVATNVCCRCTRRGWVKSSADASERRARPRMSPQMQRVLVALGFVFVFKSVRTILADILLLLFVETNQSKSASCPCSRWGGV